MPRYAVSPPAINSILIAGEDAVFPVRRVYCVGRNYAEHAKEMGVDPRIEAPFFFIKPTDTVLCPADNEAVNLPYPPGTKDLQYEVELVVAIGQGGTDIPVDEAVRHIWGYAVGIDMTRRDLQRAMRASGKPWEIGKTFERCAPISAIKPIGQSGEITSGAITLNVGSAIRQASDISSMIWSVSEIIAKLSQLFMLMPGDLIFSGTPEGVGAVVPGDTLTATLEGVGVLQVDISTAHDKLWKQQR
jgi:fumarylpyruvate hydrolase